MATCELVPVWKDGKACIVLTCKEEVNWERAMHAIPGLRHDSREQHWYCMIGEDYGEAVLAALSGFYNRLDTMRFRQFLAQRAVLHFGDPHTRPSMLLTRRCIDYPLSADNLDCLQCFRQNLEEEGYGPATVRGYTHAFNKVLQLIGHRSVRALNDDQFRTCLYRLICHHQLSVAQLQAVISALRYFLFHQLRRRTPATILPRPAKDIRSVPAMDQEEAARLFGNIVNSRHRLLLILSNAFGLRVRELVAIQLSDLDIAARSIMVRDKDLLPVRNLELSATVARELAAYLDSVKPVNYLFEGKGKGPLSLRRVQEILQKTTIHKVRYRKIHASGQEDLVRHLERLGIDRGFLMELGCNYNKGIVNIDDAGPGSSYRNDK